MNKISNAQRSRFLLVLPLIVCPFLILLFWILEGGSDSQSIRVEPSKGLNLHLPDANPSAIAALDKLSFYSMAKKDSVQRQELEALDPHFNKATMEEETVYFDEKRVAKLYAPPQYSRPVHHEGESSSENLDALADLVQHFQQPKKDTELLILQQTLEQLLAVQQPMDKSETASNHPTVAVFKVQSSQRTQGGFYGESEPIPDTGSTDLIFAVVHGTQNLHQGSVIKLRLLNDVFLEQFKIPSGTFVYGQVSLNGERLQVLIQSIPYQGHLFPVSLAVFDIDGIEGIHMPSSPEREVIKQSTDQAVQSISIPGMGQSLSSQALATGIGTAKNLLGRKVRAVRVVIKSGYRIFLKDEKRRNL